MEDGPPRGDGVPYTPAQILASGGGIRAGAAVNEESGHAACHGLLREARIMA